MIHPRIEELKTDLLRRLWDPQSIRGGGGRSVALRFLRIGHCVTRDLAAGQLTLQAMSLVYTTLLALVPLLAVVFSVLKAFGVYKQAEPYLLDFLRPLGERGTELAGQIMDWVAQLQVGVLGGLGVALLVYSAVSLIQKIESAFNYTWHITRSQALARRIADYLSVILLGPVLIFGALGITAQAMRTKLATRLLEIEPLGALARITGQVAPYLLVIAAFVLIYTFVPNTKVRLLSALTGAAVAGIMWQSLGWLFASFVVGSARFSGVYSGFAIVLLFMIWLYLNWLILLVGASVAFYHQHPEYMGVDPRNLRLSNLLREKLALMVMYLIGLNHFEGKPRWTAETLSQRVGVPSDAVHRVLDAMLGQGLLALAGETEDEYLPARALETVSLKEVLEAIRSHDEGPLLNVGRLTPEAAIDEIDRDIDRAVDAVLAGRTVRDVVLGSSGAEEGST